MTRSTISRNIVVLLALVTGGWLLFDGLHAALTGSYTLIGGRLGPWADLVRALGVNPDGALMHLVFIALGAATLVAVAGSLMHTRWARTALLVTAVLTLWYLPVGTIFAAFELLLIGLQPAPRMPSPRVRWSGAR